MKQLYKNVCFVTLLCCNSPLFAGLGPLLSFFNQNFEVEQSFDKMVEKSINTVEQQKEKAQKALEQFQALLQETQKAATQVKENINRLTGVDREFASQKLVILDKTNQVLSELVQIYQVIQSVQAAHIKALEEYKLDPEFKERGLLLEQKSIYSIEDFQKINAGAVRFESELAALKERVQKIKDDGATQKKNFEFAQQSLDDKKNEQKELKAASPEPRFERKAFTIKQRGSLLDLEERLLTLKKDLAQAQIAKADTRIQFLEFEVKITSLQFQIVKKQEQEVLNEMRVDSKDIQATEKVLAQMLQEAARLRDELGRRIETQSLLIKSIEEDIQASQKRNNLTDVQVDEISSWSLQPDSKDQWRILLDIGTLHNRITYQFSVRKDYLLAQLDQIKAKIFRAEVNDASIHTWNRLTTGGFSREPEALVKELKRYEQLETDVEGTMATLSERKAAASCLLAQYNQFIQTISQRQMRLRSQKDTVFNDNAALYKRYERALENELNQKWGELITQYNELYSAIIQEYVQSKQTIDLMIRVIRQKTQSQLIPPLWSGVKRFLPDVTRFVAFLIMPGRLQESIAQTQKSVQSWFFHLLKHPLELLLLLVTIIAFLALYVFLRLYLFKIAALIGRLVSPDFGFLSMLGTCATMTLEFIANHLTGLFLWINGFIIIQSGLVAPYASALFYLFSIPVGLYYANRFTSYAAQVNTTKEHPFASKEYHDRFFRVFSLLLSSSVILLFSGYALTQIIPQSEAPRILRAINFIIFQISLIFMISRDHILRLIPQTNALGKWFADVFDTYYYLFLSGLIFIIILSNPYLGFGTLFLYLIFRALLILLLIPLIVTVHSMIRETLGTVFFYNDDEGRTHERFKYARTSYGLFVIGSFLFFGALALLVAANIWGFSVGVRDILSWLRQDIYAYTSAQTGQRVTVNLLHIGRMLLVVFIGVSAAIMASNFVLRRIFDLLHVKAGAQSIFISLARYVIIIASIIIGLQSLGLGYSMLYILAVIGGLGVAGKEVLTDFIGYFMILIQRPLKIGDFIQLGPNLIGVVRHLTLRSVILRSKNSVTIIIPNSQVLNQPLTNWNYYRMYFAFDDIYLTIPYNADPSQVRDLFLKALDDNYNVLRNPAPIVRLESFEDSGFKFMVRGYLSHDKVLDQYDIASDIRLELVSILRRHGYKIAVPMRIIIANKQTADSLDS